MEIKTSELRYFEDDKKRRWFLKSKDGDQMLPSDDETAMHEYLVRNGFITLRAPLYKALNELHLLNLYDLVSSDIGETKSTIAQIMYRLNKNIREENAPSDEPNIQIIDTRGLK